MLTFRSCSRIACLAFLTVHSVLRAADSPASRTEAFDSWLNGSGTNAILNERYVHNFSIDGNAKRVVVFYTTATNASGNQIPALDTTPADGVNDYALKAAQATEQAWRAFRSYGFNDPIHMDNSDGATSIEQWIFNLTPGLAGWCCNGSADVTAFKIAAGLFAPGNDLGIKETIFHEFWHATSYVGLGWVDEGAAAFMQDQVDTALDTAPNMSFVGWCNNFLGNSQITLTTRAYAMAVWWKYFTEQFGTTTTEPQRGVDAIRQFYADARAGTALANLDDLIRTRSGGSRTLDSTWCDFNVANYVKNLSPGSLPAKYIYLDEVQPPGAYDFDNDPTTPPLMRVLDLDLTSASPGLIATADLRPWSAAHYRLRPDTNVAIVSVDFRQDTPGNLCWAMLMIRGGALIDEIREVGRHFTRTVANESYDEIVIVATTAANFANYRYNLNATQPVLRILDPIPSRAANVGNPATPDQFLAKVEVLGPAGTTPVEGIDTSRFRVTVGTNAATLIGPGAYVQGQYWLLVQAPMQTTTGLYSLRVSYATLTAQTNNAVNYTTRLDSDSMIVLDRSGSMSGLNKMTAAKTAATLYIDSWRPGDKIGVASFNENATTNMTLRDWTAASRDAANTNINGLTPGGATSIGDGLFAGLNELIARGNSTHNWGLVVLSDGLENDPKFIADYIATNRLRVAAMQQVPVVHCIAIGADANRGNLQDLAAATGGNYLYAAEPPAGGGASIARAGIAPTVDLPNDLAEYYRVAVEALERKQQIYSQRGRYANLSTNVHSIRIDPGASEAVFAVNWHGQSSPTVLLRRPDNVIVTASLTSPNHVVFRVGAPAAGTWRLSVIGCDASTEFCFGDYLVEASLKTDLTLHLYLATPISARRVGTPMQILAKLTDTAPVLGSTVEATISIPEYRGPLNVELPELRTLRLYDDGRHGDREANDGIYGNLFREILRPGSFGVLATATGNTPAHGDYRRQARNFFDVSFGQDSDSDGLPDSWEAFYGLDPQAGGPNDDPDRDGVINSAEYRNGTDPSNPDTDGGGESDGSELAGKGDPLNPADDGVGPLLDVSPAIISTEYILDLKKSIYNRAAILNISAHPSHATLQILRSSLSNCCFQVIEKNLKPQNRFIDKDVVPGQTYYYILIGQSAGEDYSAPLGPVAVKAKENPFEAEGLAVINGGRPNTTSLKVELQFEPPPEVTSVRVANNSAFVGAQWEKFTPTLTWLLPSSLTAGTTAYVYYQFLLADGDMTDTASAAIRYLGSELRLDVRRHPKTIELTWTADAVILEEAKSVTGPWGPVPNARSPYQLDLQTEQRFYRLSSTQ